MTHSSEELKKKDAMALIGMDIDKYKIDSYITSGGFGHVFVTTVNDDSNRVFAIKVPIQSEKKNYQKFLIQEYKVLEKLSDRDHGIMSVKLIKWENTNSNKGKNDKDSYVMVMDLLGESLNNYKRKLSLVQLVQITIQMLKIIKHVHLQGYLHRDLKASNFTIHPSNDINDGIFCIDFGLAELHPKQLAKSSFCGTETFASIAAHESLSQSWKDDLESLVYCIVSLHNGLKWKSSSISDKKERLKAIGLEKKNITPKILCKDLPNEYRTFYKYVRSLTFSEKPKYNALIQKFERLLNNLQTDSTPT